MSSKYRGSLTEHLFAAFVEDALASFFQSVGDVAGAESFTEFVVESFLCLFDCRHAGLVLSPLLEEGAFLLGIDECASFLGHIVLACRLFLLANDKSRPVGKVGWVDRCSLSFR